MRHRLKKKKDPSVCTVTPQNYPSKISCMHLITWFPSFSFCGSESLLQYWFSGTLPTKPTANASNSISPSWAASIKTRMEKKQRAEKKHSPIGLRGLSFLFFTAIYFPPGIHGQYISRPSSGCRQWNLVQTLNTGSSFGCGSCADRQ